MHNGIIITDVSDHFGIFTIIYKHAWDQPKQYSTIKSYKPQNIAKFNNLLSEADFKYYLVQLRKNSI